MTDPVTISLLAAGSGIASAGSSIMGGIAANKAAKLEQRQIEEDRKMAKLRAMQDANEVRDERNKILSRNRAVAAASGVDTRSGSFSFLQREVEESSGRDLKNIELNSLSDQNRFSLEASQSKLKGKTALTQGFFNAGSSLMKTGSKLKG